MVQSWISVHLMNVSQAFAFLFWWGDQGQFQFKKQYIIQIYNVIVYEIPKGVNTFMYFDHGNCKQCQRNHGFWVKWRVKVNSGTLTEETGQTTMVQYSGAFTHTCWLGSTQFDWERQHSATCLKVSVTGDALVSSRGQPSGCKYSSSL